jgi:hypothetical protein
MSPIIYNTLRSLVLAIIVFFSLQSLGFSAGQSVVGGLFPLFLGLLNISVGSAFTLSAAVFFVAIVAHLFPSHYATATAMLTNTHAELRPVATQNEPVQDSVTN